MFKGVNSLKIQEIAATKAYTIGRRGSFRDHVDLYFIISENYASLEEIIKIAEKKFGSDFNSRLFLEQLVYLKDIEDTDILFLKKAVSKEELEKFYIDKIKEIKYFMVLRSFPILFYYILFESVPLEIR